MGKELYCWMSCFPLVTRQEIYFVDFQVLFKGDMFKEEYSRLVCLSISKLQICATSFRSDIMLWNYRVENGYSFSWFCWMLCDCLHRFTICRKMGDNYARHRFFSVQKSLYIYLCCWLLLWSYFLLTLSKW